MRLSFLFILIVSSFTIGHAQVLTGNYEGSESYLRFRGDSMVWFSLPSKGGIIFQYVGYGHYTRSEDVLTVQTVSVSPLLSFPSYGFARRKTESGLISILAHNSVGPVSVWYRLAADSGNELKPVRIVSASQRIDLTLTQYPVDSLLFVSIPCQSDIPIKIDTLQNIELNFYQRKTAASESFIRPGETVKIYVREEGNKLTCCFMESTPREGTTPGSSMKVRKRFMRRAKYFGDAPYRLIELEKETQLFPFKL